MDKKFREIFGEGVLRMMQGIAAAAGERRMRTHLVGGAVRDMLLDQRSDDLDILVEGDAIDLVKTLHSGWHRLFPDMPAPGKPVTFPKYGTAKLAFAEEIAPGVRALDFAGARAENYPVPGGPPVVRPGDLMSDLARRDFSVNAMALELAPDSSVVLWDYHSGQSHLAEKQLHVLHDRSFVDDPARLIRGLRFAARFGFSFSPETQRLVEEAIFKKHLGTLPLPRLFDELRKAASEREPGSVLLRMNEAGLLGQIHPALEFRSELFRPRELTYPRSLRLLFNDLPDERFHDILLGFGVNRKDAQRIITEARHDGR